MRLPYSFNSLLSISIIQANEKQLQRTKQYHSGIKPPNGTQPTKRGLVPNLQAYETRCLTIWNQVVNGLYIQGLRCLTTSWQTFTGERMLFWSICTEYYVRGDFFAIVNNPFHLKTIEYRSKWINISIIIHQGRINVHNVRNSF